MDLEEMEDLQPNPLLRPPQTNQAEPWTPFIMEDLVLNPNRVIHDDEMMAICPYDQIA